jgi:hypothetical protein
MMMSRLVVVSATSQAAIRDEAKSISCASVIESRKSDFVVSIGILLPPDSSFRQLSWIEAVVLTI